MDTQSFVSIGDFLLFPKAVRIEIVHFVCAAAAVALPTASSSSSLHMHGRVTQGDAQGKRLFEFRRRRRELIFSPPPPFLVRCRRLHCLCRGEGEGQQKGGVPGNNHFFEKGEPRKKGRGIVFSF